MSESRSAPLPFFFQKQKNQGMNRKLCNAHALANPSAATSPAQRATLFPVTIQIGPGKRNLLTALIGLQRAADRRGKLRHAFPSPGPGPFQQFQHVPRRGSLRQCSRHTRLCKCPLRAEAIPQVNHLTILESHPILWIRETRVSIA